MFIVAKDVPPRRIYRIGTAGGWETPAFRTSLESSPQVRSPVRQVPEKDRPEVTETSPRRLIGTDPAICIRTSHMRRPDANSDNFERHWGFPSRWGNTHPRNTRREFLLQILQPWDGDSCGNRGSLPTLPGSIRILPGLVGLLPPPGRSMPIRGYQKGISA